MNHKCDKLKKCRQICSSKNIQNVGICADTSLCQLGNCAENNVSFNKIVEKSFYPRGNKKKDPHQYRIKDESYKKYYCRIKKMKEIMNFSDFDKILDFVTLKGKKNIHGIGKLTEYDIAFRIGKALGKCPKKLYLHAGTKEGAKKLAKKTNFDIRGKAFITRQEIDQEWGFLQNAPMCQIENFLCVCKNNPSEEAFACYKKLHTENEVD